MKICAYCTTKNRDGAIFCSHCRRPLRETPIPRDTSLIRLLAVLILIGLGSYLFLARLFFAPAGGMQDSGAVQTPSPSSTRARESVTLWTCVENDTRIRRGPSTQSETIGELDTGTCLTVLGRTQDSSWVYIVSDDHKTGWVAAHLLSDTQNIGKVSVRDSSALANVARSTLTSAEIAATTIPGAPLSSYVVPCFASAERIGEYVSCRVEKAYCDYLTEVEGSPTFCSDRPSPDHTFALVVFGEDWSDYDGQCLIVEGYLEIDRGVLQIQGLRRNQVSLCN